MLPYALPVVYALFVWWFSTGLIILLDNLPRSTHRWSMAGATGFLVASIYGLHVASADTSIAGAYLGFTCGLLAWGWQEMSFFTGFVTGPVPEPCPANCTAWQRFAHALRACLYHELAIVGTAATILAVTSGGPNQVGTWTFMALWVMRQSAKLNVFLGVRNLSEEFVPEHLAFIRSYMTTKPINLLFPLSVSALTAFAALLIRLVVVTDAGPFHATSLLFVSTLLVLGLLEHWFLVVPLPATALWGWSLRRRQKRRARIVVPSAARLRLAPAVPTRTVGGNR